ncbi:MAG: Lacal_2735 family protein [Marinoscillum sp.]
MFNLFDSRSKQEKLQAKYDKLMRKSFYLEQTDLKAAEQVKMKAQKVLMNIVELEGRVFA